MDRDVEEGGKCNIITSRPELEKKKKKLYSLCRSSVSRIHKLITLFLEATGQSVA